MSNASTLLAKCYIKEENDDRNYCLLTESTLLIKHKGKMETFFIHWVKDIVFQKRIFLIPIVFGGIAAALAGVGLFQYYLNPWFMLALLFCSSLVIYYGIQGSMSMTIVTPIKEYDFFISSVSDNLKAFAAYTISTIQGSEVSFYFNLNKEEFERAEEIGYVSPKDGGLKLFLTKGPIAEQEFLFQIDTKDLPFEIKFKSSENGELEPYIFDKIPLTHIKRCISQ